MPEPDLPAAEARERAREFGMPPLDRSRFTADAAFDATLDRLFALAAADRHAGHRARRRSPASRDADAAGARRHGARACSSDAIPVETLAEHVFVAAALQVHFARLAARLDADAPGAGRRRRLSGLRRRAGRIHGRRLAGRARHALLRLLAVRDAVERRAHQMHAVRLDQGHRLSGGRRRRRARCKAETCENCRGYVKILHQHKDPALDPVADDVATLGLDLLVRESGYRRGAVNPFLLGY